MIKQLIWRWIITETRNDSNYVCLRVTPEERAMYDEKRAKTLFSGKTLLLNCLRGDVLREHPPKEASEIHHQLLKISLNILNLSSSRNSSPSEQIQLYGNHHHRLNKIMTDITSILYLAHLWKDE
ncbi:MAG: hypothetical protein K6F76_05955 [Clostridiales bacterium]|nr:hypothetical protein [Clostridiales bacterium]